MGFNLDNICPCLSRTMAIKMQNPELNISININILAIPGPKLFQKNIFLKIVNTINRKLTLVKMNE